MGLGVEAGRCPRVGWQMPVLEGLAAGIPPWQLTGPVPLRNLGPREPRWSPSRVSRSRGGDGCTGNTGASRWLGQFWVQHKSRLNRCPGSGDTSIPLHRENRLGGTAGGTGHHPGQPPLWGAASSCVQLRSSFFPDVRGRRRRAELGAQQGLAAAAGRRFRRQPPKLGKRRLNIWFRSQLSPARPSRHGGVMNRFAGSVWGLLFFIFSFFSPLADLSGGRAAGWQGEEV